MTMHRGHAGQRSGHTEGLDATLRSMDRCTKCGLCQLYCPVAAATDRFPGPKYSGPQAQRFRIIEPVKEAAPELCSGCGVCTSVCPNDVAITDIITLANFERVEAEGGLPVRQRLLNRPDVIGRLGGLWPALANGLLSSRLLRKLAHHTVGIDQSAPLPKFRGRAFRRWLHTRQQPDGPTIAYFSGCAVEFYDPRVGTAAVEVLNHLGYRVEVAGDACCGLPMLSSGELGTAKARAADVIEALTPAAKAGGRILATSTSCSLTLRRKYAALLDEVDEDATLVAHAAVDVCEYLRDTEIEALAEDCQALSYRVLYHGPCQLRGHAMGLPAVEILRRIPQLQVSISETSCCGVAGTYGYDRDKRAIAAEVGAGLRAQIAEVNPDFVVCDSETCRWSIEASSGRPCLHPIEVLAASLLDRDPLAATIR